MKPRDRDFLVPKQLGRALRLALAWPSPELMVRRRLCTSAIVRRRCHAVRHSPTDHTMRHSRGLFGADRVENGTVDVAMGYSP